MANLALVKIAIVSLISLTTAANAQERDAVDRVAGLAPIAGFTTQDSRTGHQDSVAFFIKPRRDLRLPDGMPWIDYVASRRSSGNDGASAVMWTSSEDCPALRNTLIWLTTLVAPRVEIPGITPNEGPPDGRRPLSVVDDGLQTTVWGRGTQPDHVANTRVEMSSNGGLIAQFGAAATQNLAGCWRSRKPAD